MGETDWYNEARFGEGPPKTALIEDEANTLD